MLWLFRDDITVFVSKRGGKQSVTSKNASAPLSAQINVIMYKRSAP